MRIRIRHEQFSHEEFERWKKKRYSILADTYTPLKNVLRRKARHRPGRRFFGEALMAARTEHRRGWYGSFKWMTSPKWCGDVRLNNRYEEEVRKALRQYFPELRKLQKAGLAAARKFRCKRPVGPDLWLIDGRHHRFIEVKLPGDRIGQHQLLGLALIAAYRPQGRVSLEIALPYTTTKQKEGDGWKRRLDSMVRRVVRVKVDAIRN